MTWTKLSDDFGDDCWELSDAAYRLHVEGLLWSNRKLLDLRIPKSDMRRGWAKHPEAVSELVTIGWWKDKGDHYLIVHHGTYQRSRAAVLAQQEANLRNGRKGGRPPGPPRERAPRKPRKKPSPETDSVTESESEWVSGEHGPTAQETDSLTDSPTERDGTGQARTREPSEDDERVVLPMAAGAENVTDWEFWNGTGSKPPKPSPHEWRGAGPNPFEEYK